MDDAEELGRKRPGPEETRHHRFDLALTEKVKRDLPVVGLVRPPYAVPRPVGRDEQRRNGSEAIHQEREIVLGSIVDPVQVLLDDDQGPTVGTGGGESAKRLEGLLPLLLGLEMPQRRVNARGQ